MLFQSPDLVFLDLGRKRTAGPKIRMLSSIQLSSMQLSSMQLSGGALRRFSPCHGIEC